MRRTGLLGGVIALVGIGMLGVSTGDWLRTNVVQQPAGGFELQPEVVGVSGAEFAPATAGAALLVVLIGLLIATSGPAQHRSPTLGVIARGLATAATAGAVAWLTLGLSAATAEPVEFVTLGDVTPTATTTSLPLLYATLVVAVMVGVGLPWRWAAADAEEGAAGPDRGSRYTVEAVRGEDSGTPADETDEWDAAVLEDPDQAEGDR